MNNLSGTTEMCRDFATKAKVKIDIVTVVQDYLILRQSGHIYSSLCPFHVPTSATFQVDQRNQSFQCVECGAAGDYYDFLLNIQQLNNPDYSCVDAIKEIQTVYIGHNYSHLLRKTSDRYHEVEEIYSAHQFLADLYHNFLFSEDGRHARKYLANRSISLEAIKEFNIGFAPDIPGFASQQLEAAGYNMELMVEGGLVGRNDQTGNYYDYFRSRVMFPIHNINQRVVAFGGRALSDRAKPKYLNSKETPIFIKGEHLYNLSRAAGQINKDNQKFYIFEGYLDVIAAWQGGCLTGVAPLGTSLTGSQSRLLTEYSNQTSICYDGDEAGQKATLKAIRTLQSYGFGVSVTVMPDGLDPDEFIKKFGAEVFQTHLQEYEMSLTEYYCFQNRIYFRPDEPSTFKMMLDKIMKAVTLTPNLPSETDESFLEDQFNISLKQCTRNYYIPIK
ncbi:DNA primase [Paenibacillus taichungensis]|uniref:DNA primase n=1 Tax=Paenibacillus taichungensis TaxID=484184 RepID=A0ABX2MLJ9_9BACL|nr:DNA primase [Paenibacillus taichungensis]NUU54928.1 DNA primase [Paenibacillus taichungensis]